MKLSERKEKPYIWINRSQKWLEQKLFPVWPSVSQIYTVDWHTLIFHIQFTGKIFF